MVSQVIIKIKCNQEKINVLSMWLCSNLIFQEDKIYNHLLLTNLGDHIYGHKSMEYVQLW